MLGHPDRFELLECRNDISPQGGDLPVAGTLFSEYRDAPLYETERHRSN